MSGTESQEPAASAIDKYNLHNLTPDFCKELVGDLAGLGEAFQSGTVNQSSFLLFCVGHLKKIDTFIESRK